MMKLATLILALGLSLSANSKSFGPTPSRHFNKSGDLSCESKSNCKIPSYRTLQKIAEDFIAFSVERTAVIDQIESKIQAGTQTYKHELETTFSKIGNTDYKSFLEIAKLDYEGLLDKLGLSSARQLVSGNSPFMNELKNLQTLLKTADARVTNSSSPDEQRDSINEKKQNYFDFRTNGSFTSFKYIDQVKDLVEHYLKNKNLNSWLTVKEKALRLSFNSCPLKVRRAIRKRRPSIKIDSELKAFKFDVFNHPNFVLALVDNSRLLKINCRNKASGRLLMDLDTKKAALNIDYQNSHNGTPILPLK